MNREMCMAAAMYLTNLIPFAHNGAHATFMDPILTGYVAGITLEDPSAADATIEDYRFYPGAGSAPLIDNYATIRVVFNEHSIMGNDENYNDPFSDTHMPDDFSFDLLFTALGIPYEGLTAGVSTATLIGGL